MLDSFYQLELYLWLGTERQAFIVSDRIDIDSDSIDNT
jgi:hypothetical protein